MAKGMGWVDTGYTARKPAEAVIKEAVAAYEAKNGRKPGLVQVHPSLAADETVIDGVAVRPSRLMGYPNYVYLVDPERSLDEQ